MLFSRKPLKELVFQGFLCYNKDMKNEVNITTSSTEMMTISRAEYESLKAERDELNQKLDWLMEQVRLAKKKVYGHGCLPGGLPRGKPGLPLIPGRSDPPVWRRFCLRTSLLRWWSTASRSLNVTVLNAVRS